MIAITSVVKDEADCIRYMLDYHIEKGFENFFIMDNDSTDGTYEILEEYKARKDIKLMLYYDPEVNHFQSYKMTKLAQLAYNHGNRFILPLDGDELLVMQLPIDELRKQLFGLGVALIDWKHYHPTEKDPTEKMEPIKMTPKSKPMGYAGEPNPFKRLQYTSGTQKNLSKCLIHWKPGMRVYQGNHGIDNPGHFEQIRLAGAYVANFPWRSREQAKKKIINNGISHQNISDNSAHIKENYRNFLKDGESFIDKFWKGCIIPSEELEYLPI